MFFRQVSQVELNKWWKWILLFPVILFSLIIMIVSSNWAKIGASSSVVWVLLGIIFLFVFCFLYILDRYVITPLKMLQKIAENMIIGESGKTFELHGPREIIDIGEKLTVLVNRFKQQATELALVQEDLSQHSKLAALVGHEIRTPLNGISGMLDLVKSTALTKHQQECIDVARKSSRILVEFINTILDEKTVLPASISSESQEDNVSEGLKELLAQTDSLRSSRLDQALRMHRYQNRDKKKCVLVVEDNHTNQLVAGGMLRALGYDYGMVWNGVEALSILSKTPFDLILMDCNMPEMNGYDATQKIRELEYGTDQHIPIIAMTADAQQGVMERCKEVGMDDYLLKPVLLADLRSTLHKWLNQHLKEVDALTEHLFEVRDEPSIDEATLGALKELLGEHIEATIKPYLEDMPLYIADFEEAAVKANRDQLLALLHVMKGASGHFGAIVLLRYLQDMQSLVCNEHYDAVLEKLIIIQEEFTTVHAILGINLVGRETPIALSSAAGYQVLVVDDDRCTRYTLRSVLQEQGFRVEEAGNGVQALLMLKYFHPDAIILNGIMPVMDGFTACARIQELPEGNSIPILMVTALDDAHSMEQALAVGANDYITKPIYFATLSQRLHRLIEMSQTEKKALHLVYNDVLTGLPNRKLFFEQLDKIIIEATERGTEFALLFLNIKRFRQVNDAFGHTTGDRLLVAVSQRIRHSVRSTDFVARIGGDEFAIIFSDVPDISGITAAAKNLMRALGVPLSIDGHDIIVSTCAGIALYPQDAKNSEELLRQANTAMIQAKSDHTGIEFFSVEMERLLLDKNRLEMDLSEALAQNSFQLYYQPQADLHSGKIVGVEALLRWNHPIRGFISPMDFIPLAEELGLMGLLGLWVLRTACSQLQAWLDAGFPVIRMAVNVSMQQLLHQDFVQQVAAVLAETQLKPELLELEITESMLMENAKDTLQILHDLRALGVRMSIDDFGTGYSSLAYLRQFPVNILKIDRSFTLDVPDNTDACAIVAAVIVLAHSLRLEVVAEGVETLAQLQFLQQQQCDMLQGYYLSKPVPAKQLTQEFMEKTHFMGGDL